MVYQRQITEAVDYLSAITPYVVQHGKGLALYSDSSVVMMAAYHEHFLRQTVGIGTRHREVALRSFLRKHGSPHERTAASACKLPELVRMSASRVSFERRGARLETIWNVLFGISPWPTEANRQLVVDLFLVRNLVLHQAGAEVVPNGPDGEVGDFTSQIKSDVMEVQYGGLLSSVDRYKALQLLHRAMHAFTDQLSYLRSKLNDDKWCVPNP